MRLEAFAKINWSLDITGIREDGYHLMGEDSGCDRATRSVRAWASRCRTDATMHARTASCTLRVGRRAA